MTRATSIADAMPPEAMSVKGTVRCPECCRFANRRCGRDAPIPECLSGICSALAEEFHARPACPARTCNVDVPYADIEKATHNISGESGADLLNDDRDGELADEQRDPGQYSAETRRPFGLQEFLQGIQVDGECIGADQFDQPEKGCCVTHRGNFCCTDVADDRDVRCCFTCDSEGAVVCTVFEGLALTADAHGDPGTPHAVAISRLMRSAPAYPPVMQETISGARSV